MPDSDFFISYTSEDRAWAEWIAWQLEQDGYRVLIQAWDMVPGSNWVHRMQAGVRESSRTVAVLSRTYLSSVYGQAEWHAAWRDDPLGERQQLLVLRVEDCERPGLLGAVVSVDLFGVDEAASRRRLHEAVRGALTGRLKPSVPPGFPGGPRAVTVRPQFPGALAEIWHVPARNPAFTGREAELSLLHKAFRTGATVHALLGMAGVGKSQLMVEYAHRHSADFDVVWWIPAEDPALIPDHLAALGRELGAPDGALTGLRDRQRWLVVFDDADDPAAVRDHLPPGSGLVVVTTRRNGFRALGEVVELGVLDRPDSVALVRRRLPAVSGEDADRLAAALGDLPLAIEQTSAYMDVTGVPVPGYLELLRTDAAALIRQGHVRHHRGTLATLWNPALRALAREHPAARQLLGVLVHLAPEPVPLDLFTAHPEVLPPPLAAAVTRPVEFANAVGALVDHYLVRRTAGELRFAHDLVRHSVRVALSREHDDAPGLSGMRVPGPFTDMPLIALDLLAAHLPGRIADAPEDLSRWQALLPHVLAACAADHPTSATAWLLDRAATFLHVHDRPEEAEPLFARAVAIAETVYGPEHPNVATCLTNYGGLLRDLGRPADALPLLERARAVDSVSEPGPRSVAANLSGIGLVLLDLGRPGEARPVLEDAFAITLEANGPGHPDVAVARRRLEAAAESEAAAAYHRRSPPLARKRLRG